MSEIDNQSISLSSLSDAKLNKLIEESNRNMPIGEDSEQAKKIRIILSSRKRAPSRSKPSFADT